MFVWDKKALCTIKDQNVADITYQKPGLGNFEEQKLKGRTKPHKDSQKVLALPKYTC